MRTKFTILLMLFASVFLMGQTTTSNVKGVVLDDSGEPLPEVEVVAIHTPTGTKYRALSNEEGRYSMVNMRVGGPYTVTASFVGFEDISKGEIYLTLGQTSNVDLTFGGNATSEIKEVVVTGAKNNVFNNDRTGAETTIGSRELQEMPTISRSASDFYRLEPSSSGGSFGGRNDQFNNFSLDGSIFNNPFGLDAATPGGQTSSQPVSLDAIEQIQVSTAPYDVTMAGFTGASVNAVTKSGTNKFKGTVYGFFRNEDMTGDKVSGNDIFKADLEQKQYGFSLGGPIVKDKLFFFVNFEKDDRTDLGSNYFADTDNDPTNNNDNTSRVTAADLNTVSSLLSGLGYDTGAYEGYLHDTQSDKGIFKLDWNINDNHRLAFIYNFLNASQGKNAHPNALGRRGPDATTLQFANSGYRIDNNIDSYLIELNSTFADNKFANKLQLGYTHFDDSRTPFSAPMPAITIQEDGINYIIAGHEPFSIHNSLDQKVYQITNNFNAFLGNHTLTIGASFEKFMFDNSFNLGAYGYGDDRGYVGAFGAFSSVAAFETAVNNGLIATAQENAQAVYDAGNWALAETNVGQLAFYAQDAWDVTDNLKLTFGLRIDKPLYFDTEDNIAENIARKGGTIDEGGTYAPGVEYYDENGNAVYLNSLQLPSEKILWSPRFGFNWDALGDKTLQVRGGTGVFTGRLPFVWIGNQVANPDFFYYTITDPDFEFPQVWRSSLGMDYKFDNGLVFTGDIAYTKDLNSMMVRNYGLRTPGETLQGVDNRPIYGADDRAQGPFGGATNAYVFTNTDKGYSFNSTIKLAKKWNNGLYSTLAYNYLTSKDASSIEAEISGDAYDRNPALGNVNQAVETNSLYGDRHRFVGTLNKKFRYGQGKWATTLSAFFEYAQGGRFSYTYSGDINNDGSALNDLIYIPTESELQQMTFSGTETEQAAQRAAFEQYIRQDDYLSDHRGQYQEKYAILSPWRGRWDVRFMQDFNFKVSEDRMNTIQFTVDILNFGNLLNSDWGVVEMPTTTQPIGVTVENGTPVYSFDTGLTKTFTDDISLNSRWQMQFGLRYIF